LEAAAARKAYSKTKYGWRIRSDEQVLEAMFADRCGDGKMRGGPKARVMTKEERMRLWNPVIAE
jgi:hypothetical protein